MRLAQGGSPFALKSSQFNPPTRLAPPRWFGDAAIPQCWYRKNSVEMTGVIDVHFDGPVSLHRRH